MLTEENIDQDEVEKFSAHADDWWNHQGVFKTLHDINPARLGFIIENVKLTGQKVLDLGCGGGILSEAMAGQGAEVIGLDASIENINAAKAHAANTELKLEYINGNIENYALENSARFDLITCMEMLEHVPDPQSIIENCAKLIKSGGHIIFSTINRNVKSYLYAIIAAEYVLKLLPVGTHHYKNFIRPSELTGWCRAHGLSLNDLKGMQYNPLLERYSLNENPDVNYLIDTIAG